MDKKDTPGQMLIPLSEVDKYRPHHVGDLVSHSSGSLAGKIILEKITGLIVVYALDVGQELAETKRFDKYVLIIEGAVNLTIRDVKYELIEGQGMIIPARAEHYFHPVRQVKMLSATIKSGYEE